MLDADEFGGTVDIGDFEGDCLGDAQSGSVAGEQAVAVLDAGDMVQKALGLIGGKDDGEFFIQAGSGEVMLLPRQLQGDQIEELDGGDEGVDGLRGELALLGEIELVLADGFEVEFGRVAVEVFGEFDDIMDVASLRSGGEVADAHAACTQSCLRSCVDVVVSCVRLLRVLDWSIATTESSVSRSLAPRYGSRWREVAASLVTAKRFSSLKSQRGNQEKIPQHDSTEDNVSPADNPMFPCEQNAGSNCQDHHLR